ETGESTVRVRGVAAGYASLQRVEISGTPAVLTRRDGGDTEFQSDTPLNVGDNNLQGYVVDANGAREPFSLAVKRLPPAGPQQPPETEVLLDKVQRFEERGGRLASLHGIRQSLFSEYVSQGTTTLFQIDELMEFQQRDYVEYHSVHGDGYAVRWPEGGYNF